MEEPTQLTYDPEILALLAHDLAEYQELLASRTRLMKPKGSTRYSVYRSGAASGMRRRYA